MATLQITPKRFLGSVGGNFLSPNCDGLKSEGTMMDIVVTKVGNP